MVGPTVNPDPTGLVSLVPLHKTHAVEDFSCGREPLDAFLKKYALIGPPQGLSQTWVAVSGSGQVLGYYTLGASAIRCGDASARVTKGMPRYDIPVVLLARLAIDISVQGRGLGRTILLEAMRKAVALGRLPLVPDGEPGLPLRAMLVHALDDQASAFYRHFGFERSPTDPLHLMMLLKDIEAVLLTAK